ncbi:MAG: type IV pilus modification protein PilV [Ideonella sp.]|nr:type IV pilus modification protein PilV [Ideonella sp.]
MLIRPPRTAPRQRQTGVTLMEALIAVVLLSMCALAYASLQLRGLSSNASAMWRSKAVMLAYEMSDRLRTNAAGLALGSYNNLVGTPAAVNDCGSASACAPARMAQFDHFQWNVAVGRDLPSGLGSVCLDSTPDDGTLADAACDGLGTTFAVKVFWQERDVESRLVVAVRP